MAEISDLSVTDANNVARFPEGQGIPTLVARPAQSSPARAPAAPPPNAMARFR